MPPERRQMSEASGRKHYEAGFYVAMLLFVLFRFNGTFIFDHFYKCGRVSREAYNADSGCLSA